VAKLEEMVQSLLERLTSLEADRNEARKELARRDDNDARERARGAADQTGPHPIVK
jgi:hypothetical protein